MGAGGQEVHAAHPYKSRNGPIWETSRDFPPHKFISAESGCIVGAVLKASREDEGIRKSRRSLIFYPSSDMEVVMAFCSACGTQMADNNSAFCPKCGKATGTGVPAVSASTSTGAASGSLPMAENVAGMLAYVTIIPAIFFLLIEPFNRNRFVRFHAFQCLFTCGALIVLQVVLSIFSHILPVLMVGIWGLLGLAEFALWVLLVFKAYQHEMFKLPIVGDMAEKQADA